MNHKSVFYFVLSGMVLMGCGSGSNETVIKSQDGNVEIDNIRQSGEKMKEKLDEYKKKREERLKRGDTLAMSYQDLERYLPVLDGYKTKKPPKGERVTMPSIGSWSKTEQQYEGPDGSIEVEIADYNQSYNAFSMAAAVFSISIQVENDREKSGSFDTGIPGVRGYEKIFKKKARISQTYAISDRFFIRVGGKDGVSSETLKEVVKRIPLAELAAK